MDGWLVGVFSAFALVLGLPSSAIAVSSPGITEFPIPTADSVPLGIAAGPDGNVWFTEFGGNRIGRITPSGTITEFPLLTAYSYPYGIAAGADGNLWFTEQNGNRIGRITPSGTITEFPIPTANSVPYGIAAGADGNVWFTEYNGNKIGRIGLVAPAITSAAGVTFTAGQAGSFTVTTTGFPSVSISAGGGVLPPGVSFTDNGDGTATLSGTPAAGTGGSYKLTLTASNGVPPAATQAFTLTVIGPPASTGPPAITGTLKAGSRLSCSTGTWTNSPTGYAYQWSRGGTPIIGASAQSYTLQKIDQGLTLTCTVTASNPAGTGAPATSAAVLVPVPFVAHCPGATGRLVGRTLGLVTLGMTRARARHAFTHSSNRGRRYQDFFCLTPIGVRVGYASPTVLNTLSRSARRHVLGRVVWASTSSAFYTVRGIRPGATLTAAQALGLGAAFHIGLNDWYTAPNGSSIAVLKVRLGIVQEIGIADKQLARSRKAQGTLMSSFS